MIERIEGIIIKDSSYSETSKLVTLITKEHGVINLLAKGAKTLKSPLRSTTTKLTHGYFNIIYKESKLSTLKEVDVIDYYKNIKQDINKISYASYILELVEQVIKQTNNEEVFDNLVYSLKKIEENMNPLVITNILELKCLDYLGVMPILDCCSVCGNKNIITISADQGGYICKNCRKDETIVDERTIKLLRMFYYVDINKIDKLEISKKISEEINYFLNAYYERYTGLYLKSKKFIEKLSKVGEKNE
ncbi:MAG: DNA repair protein RecO [Bacilli bacterium]